MEQVLILCDVTIKVLVKCRTVIKTFPVSKLHAFTLFLPNFYSHIIFNITRIGWTYSVMSCSYFDVQSLSDADAFSFSDMALSRLSRKFLKFKVKCDKVLSSGYTSLQHN